MRRLLLSIAWLATVAGAFLLHRSSLDSMKDPYQRGTYALLVDAEQALAQGQPTLALAHLRASFVRAQYEGQAGVAERVRWRMALAGRDFLANGADAAWPCLESYALLSDDFGRDALAIEALLLQMPVSPKPIFEYHLTRPDGGSFWGDPWATEWTGLWTVWRWWEDIRGKSVIWGVTEQGGLHAEMGLEKPGSRFGSQVILFLRPGPNPPSGTVTVEAPAASRPVGCWFFMASEFKPGTPAGPGRWTLPGQATSLATGPSKVAVFTDAVPPHEGYQILLVREYKPLPPEDDS